MTTSESSIRVSVIMPFLNAELFIDEAIQSVLAQEYTGWELILVDDGSTDGSGAIAHRYANEQPERIRCLAHGGGENRGQAASRNVGIAHARGEYLAPLDADDIWLPNKLIEQISLMDSQPQAGAMFGRTFWWYSWTGEPADQQHDYAAALGFPSGTLIDPPNLLVGCLDETVPMPLLTTMMFRRSAVECIGGFVEEFRNPFEDQAFLTKMFVAFPILASDVIWAKYRRHSNSACVLARRSGEMESAAKMYFEWTRNYLAKGGAKDSEAWRALQRRIWRNRHPRLTHLWHRLSSLPQRISHSLRRVKPA